MTPLRTCRALALAGAFMCVLAIPPAVHAQSEQQSQPATPQPATPQPATQPSESEDGSKLPVSLDRIREGVQREPKLKIDFLDPNIPLFRISVNEKPLKLEDYWKIGPDTAVSRDVRTYHASTWHHEFLNMTTPKQHIAASPFGIMGNPMFPVGPPIFAISSALKKAFSNMERGRIRRQIQEELKQIETNNAQQKQQAETETQQTPAEETPVQDPQHSKKQEPKPAQRP
jgi:hypothetical protein